MEGSWKTRAFWAALIAVPLVAGVWIWAKYSVKDRIGEFARRAAQVSAQRGGWFPTEADVRAQLEAHAADLDLTVSDVRVTFVRGAQSPAARMVEQRLAKAFPPGAPAPPRPRVIQTRIDVVATVRGRALLWTAEDTIESSTILNGEPRPSPM